MSGCVICGGHLPSNRGRPRKVCSATCFKQHRANRNKAKYLRLAASLPVRQCAICFSPIASPYIKGCRRITCSEGCKRQRIKDTLDQKKPAAKDRACDECKKVFTTTLHRQRFCSRICQCRGRLNSPSISKPVLYCGHCNKEYRTGRSGDGDKYCSRECSFRAMRSRRLERADRLMAGKYTAVYAKDCSTCAQFVRWGKSPRAIRCALCVSNKRDQVAYNAVMKNDKRTESYTRRGSGRSCVACGSMFCPIGTKAVSRVTCSDVCRDNHGRAMKTVEKVKRRAKTTEVDPSFSPQDIFNRDRWRCRICYKPTPARLRNKNHHASPELDHVVPLARGGAHSLGNTQCLCRECNGWKSDRMLHELPIADIEIKRLRAMAGGGRASP